MAASKKPEYSQEQVENASEMWGKFTVFTKWGCVGVVVLLAGMALFLL